MGCCSSVKHSEAEQIVNYFNGLLKENDFNFSIKNYKYNYDRISKISGNNFKKLSKKQDVCLEFIQIIKKNKSDFINNNQIEDEMKKILYYIILLTLLLDHKMKELISINDNSNDYKNQININNLINIKRDLLSHGYNIFNVELSNLNNYKLIIYYLTKMFYLCFIEFTDASNYVSLKILTNKIQLINENNCLTDEEEKYLFIRDNILTLGQFFHYNKNFNLSEEELIDILIELFSIILYYHDDYFTSNFLKIKDIINNNIRNTTNKLMNLNLIKKENLLPSMKQAFDIIDSDNNNNDKNTRDSKDIVLIIDSLYYFLKVCINDIQSGKNTFDKLRNKLIEKIKEVKEYKFNDIILLLLFYECCIKDDEKLTSCLLEYIGELFFNNNLNSNTQINSNNIYYDITLDSYYLIFKSETLNKQYTSLLSKIFVKELKNNVENPLFITQLIQIYHKKEKKMNKLIKLFFNFMLNLSIYYKEKINLIYNNDKSNKEDIDKYLVLIKKILINLSTIIMTYFINNNGISSLSNDNNSINNYIKALTKNISHNINYDKDYSNNAKLLIEDYELLIQNFFNLKNIKDEKLSVIEFYLYLHLFIINNMDSKELIYDISKKEKIYNGLFKIITRLEIMLIQDYDLDNSTININTEKKDKNVYINNILIAIQIILLIIKIDDTKYIQDCYILNKSLEKNVQSLLEIQKRPGRENNEIESFNLKIIYSILFFTLSQFIRLINIPYSIIKNHKEIIDCIIKSNEKCGKYLSNIDVSNFNINKEVIEPNYQYLKDSLFSKEKDYDSFYINYNSFKNILDIIYSKLFGKESSLHIFFDNQINNSKLLCNISLDKSVSKVSDNITEAKDISVINYYAKNCNNNYIDDISIQIIEQNNKQKNNSNDIDNLYKSHDSQIKMPDSDENNDYNKRVSTNSLTNDENPYQNFKV